jgi:hypothetical protein
VFGVLHKGQATVAEQIKQLNGLFLRFSNDCLLLLIVAARSGAAAFAKN